MDGDCGMGEFIGGATRTESSDQHRIVTVMNVLHDVARKLIDDHSIGVLVFSLVNIRRNRITILDIFRGILDFEISTLQIRNVAREKGKMRGIGMERTYSSIVRRLSWLNSGISNTDEGR